jgi:hypothetical protein
MIFDVQPVEQCARSPKCLRRDKHAGDCGGHVAVIRDAVRKQSLHIGNMLAAKVLRALGHEVSR